MRKEDHNTTDYGAACQDRLQAGRRASAERVMPLMLDLCAPSSIVDFGCGLGSWLAEAMAFGVVDVLGVDGSWVDPAMLEIPPTCFRSVELRSRLDLGRRFDLALCLEVAEHLPAEAAPSRTVRCDGARKQSRRARSFARNTQDSKRPMRHSASSSMRSAR